MRDDDELIDLICLAEIGIRTTVLDAGYSTVTLFVWRHSSGQDNAESYHIRWTRGDYNADYSAHYSLQMTDYSISKARPGTTIYMSTNSAYMHGVGGSDFIGVDAKDATLDARC